MPYRLRRWLRRLAIFLALILAVVALWWGWVLLYNSGRTPDCVFDEILVAVQDANVHYSFILGRDVDHFPPNPYASRIFRGKKNFGAVYDDDGYDGVEFRQGDLDSDKLKLSSDRVYLGSSTLERLFAAWGSLLVIYIVTEAADDDDYAVVMYYFDPRTNILTRDRFWGYEDVSDDVLDASDEALFEIVLPVYFENAGEESAFSMDNMGEFTREEAPPRKKGDHSRRTPNTYASPSLSERESWWAQAGED